MSLSLQIHKDVTECDDLTVMENSHLQWVGREILITCNSYTAFSIRRNLLV